MGMLGILCTGRQKEARGSKKYRCLLQLAISPLLSRGIASSRLNLQNLT